MKILSYIVIVIVIILIIAYCTVIQGLKNSTWGGWTPQDTELTEEQDTLVFQSENRKLSAKDAVEKLKSTRSFANDFRSNQASFSVKIDNLTADSNEYYYMKTIYLDRNKNEQTISSYRISSKFGTVAKKNMKTNTWNELN